MKKITLLLISVFALSLMAEAQVKFGVRGGYNQPFLNYEGADIEGLVTDADPDDPNSGDVTKNIDIQTKSNNYGFHFGGMLQINLAAIFLQPELLFVSTSSDVEMNIETIPEGSGTPEMTTKTVTETMYRLDVPLYGGVKVGPARFGLGPVASFNFGKLNSNGVQKQIEDVTGEEGSAEQKFETATWALQFGAGLNILGKVAVDAKFEWGLSNLGSGIEVGDDSYDFSQRNNQLILSVGWMF